MRYGLTGIGALALLSLVDRMRELDVTSQPTLVYLLGVTPNFAAAIAITFVLLCIWTESHREAGYARVRHCFVACLSISGGGLLAWEFLQKTSRRMIFDPHDIGATLIGLGMAALLFRLVTPRPSDVERARRDQEQRADARTA